MSLPVGEFAAILRHLKRFGGKHWVATYTGTGQLTRTTDVSPELLSL